MKGAEISKIRAIMLQDCAGDGMSEVFSIAPSATWAIRGGRFSGKKVETSDDLRSTVQFEGTVRGGVVKGFVREWDYIEGVGVVCDTLKRTFTAKRS